MLKYFDFEKEVELIDKSIVENETISKNSNEKNYTWRFFFAFHTI